MELKYHTNNKEYRWTKELWLIPVFFVLSLVILLFASFCSPLYEYKGYDSAIFMLVGKAVAAGKLMYVDIFDHKGPVMFFLQAFLMKAGGVNAVFCFEVVNLTLIFYIIYKIYRLFALPPRFLFIPILLISILMLNTLEGGNVTEEYSIPLLLGCLYLAIRYMLDDDERHPPKYAFCYGIAFSLLALIRITNAAGLCGIIAAVSILLVYEREWENLFKNIIYFLIGVACICFPIGIYFLENNAFNEMVYATFTFNSKYAGGIFSISYGLNPKDILYLTRIYGPNIFTLSALIVYSVYWGRNNKLILITFFSCLFTSSALLLGLRTDHYMMLNIMPFVIGCLLFINLLICKQCKVIFKIGLSVYLILLFGYFGKRATSVAAIYAQSKDANFYYLDKTLVDNIIPFDERDSVFGYNLASNWYLETDILPPFRFYTSQEIWARTDSLVYRETNKYLKKTPPRWIVIPNPYIAHSTKGVDSNPVLKDMIKNDYELKGEDFNHKYYRRIN
ncbi:hypothetical protein [Dysgonomonas sp. 520]|uniref:hypothetical protein n=1 Tax=Dysgonomonas sp. 520 TaxID=2302931 RepID=UPI0013D04CAE|nr:hypothetical protein [Dysgonomonas sp. 520]NDW10532.1 hypothetical protein [Dysgonomonas sp. 520]